MDTKSWWMSKTIWASILIVLVSVLRMLGRPEAEALEEESVGISTWIPEFITMILAAFAFIGRITAKKVIG